MQEAAKNGGQGVKQIIFNEMTPQAFRLPLLYGQRLPDQAGHFSA